MFILIVLLCRIGVVSIADKMREDRCSWVHFMKGKNRSRMIIKGHVLLFILKVIGEEEDQKSSSWV